MRDEVSQLDVIMILVLTRSNTSKLPTWITYDRPNLASSDSIKLMSIMKS